MKLRRPTSAQFDWIERRAKWQRRCLEKQDWTEVERNDEKTWESCIEAERRGYDMQLLRTRWWQIVLPEWERQAGMSWGEHQERISRKLAA